MCLQSPGAGSAARTHRRTPGPAVPTPVHSDLLRLDSVPRDPAAEPKVASRMRFAAGPTRSSAPDASSSAVSGSLAVVTFFHCCSSSSFAACLEELRRRPRVHIEVVLDVAVAQHEVLPDLDRDQVLRREVRHHVDVLDALVGVLDVPVERLLVEDRRRGALVLVRPAADLDHALHERDGEFRVLLGHHVAAGDGGGDVGHLQAPVRIPGQVLDRRELARRLREHAARTRSACTSRR